MFRIDTQGDKRHVKGKLSADIDDDTDSDIDIDPTKLKIEFQKSNIAKRIKSTKDFDLDKFSKDMGWGNKKKPGITLDLIKDLGNMANEIKPLEEVMKKSVVRSGFERLKKVPQYDPSDKKLRERRKREREKTKGKKWFNLPATEMTDEVKHDLEIIQMRSVLDPKRFYKKNDLKVLPKYFQIGKVMDAPQDFYTSRLTKKERKRTIVDELMADAEFSKYNKRKYKEIIDEKQKQHYKAHKRAKKLKKNK